MWPQCKCFDRPNIWCNGITKQNIENLNLKKCTILINMVIIKIIQYKLKRTLKPKLIKFTKIAANNLCHKLIKKRNKN